MTLPTYPRKAKRPVAVSFRFSVLAAEQLKTLAKEHNISQPDVLENLIQAEYDRFLRNNGETDMKKTEYDKND